MNFLFLGGGARYMGKWWFPKIRGTFLGVPIIRTIVYWGLFWGPLILGNFQIPQNRSNFATPRY